MKEQRLDKGKNRILAFDLLRGIAALMVICLHTTIYYWDRHMPGTDFFILNVMNCLGRIAVPLFFMISGACLIERGSDIRYVLKKAALLIWVYFIWAALYAGWALIDTMHYQTSGRVYLSYFADARFHLWFLPVLVCSYLLLPVLSILARYENGKYIRYAAVLFLIMGCARESILWILPEQSGYAEIIGKFEVPLCGYIGYMILGYVLLYQKRKLPSKVLLAGYVLFLFFRIACNQVISIYMQKPTNIWENYFLLPVCLEAVCLFCFFVDMESVWQKSRERLLISGGVLPKADWAFI